MDEPNEIRDWQRVNTDRLTPRVLTGLQHIADLARRGMAGQQGDAAGDAIANPGMGLDLTPPALRSIWAIVTDQLSTSQALYSFAQIVHDQDEPVTVNGGMSGEYNLLEVNGNTGVPIGTVVVAWPSEDNYGENWRFEFCCGNAVATLGEDVWTTDQDDWEPPTGAGTVLIESTVPVNLNGIELDEGQEITLINIGDYPITIINEAPTSTVENQFFISEDGAIIIGPSDTITIWQNPQNGQNTIISTTGNIIRPVQTITPDGPIDSLEIDPNTEDVFFVLDEDQPITGIFGGVAGQTVTLTNSPGSTGNLTTFPGISTPGYIPWIVRPGQSLDIIFEDGEWTVLQPAGPQNYTPTIGTSNNNLQIPPCVNVLAPTITGATTITGVSADTTFLVIANPIDNNHAITLPNEDADSLEENQFFVVDNEDIVLDPGEVSFWVLDPVTETGWLYAGGSSPPSAGADEKVKVSSNDTTAGYLNGKLVAGSNITLTENSDGGDETLTIAATGGASLTSGTAALGSPYTVTTGYASTGLSVSLPSSGTYLLLCNIFSSIDGSQHEKSNFRLYNSTDAAAVGPVGIHELAATTAAQAQGCSVTLHAIVTVAASKTIQLQAITDTTGTAEVAATETTLSYVKIA